MWWSRRHRSAGRGDAQRARRANAPYVAGQRPPWPATPQHPEARLRFFGRELFTADEWAGVGWSENDSVWEIYVTVADPEPRVAELAEQTGIGPLIARPVERSFANLRQLERLMWREASTRGFGERVSLSQLEEPTNCVVIGLTGDAAVEDRVEAALPPGVRLEVGYPVMYAVGERPKES